MQDDLKKCYENLNIMARSNAYHIAVINDEMGETRDEIKEVNNKVSCVFDILTKHKETLTEVKTDLVWVKKIQWFLITTSIGTLVSIVAAIFLYLVRQ